MPSSQQLLPAVFLFTSKAKKYLTTLLTGSFLLLFIQTKAQVLITGSVHTAKDDSPIPFATVIQKGSKIATSCDAEGNFTIKLPALPAKLQFSAVGFKTKEISVKSATIRLTVVLEEISANLDEVVVVGYGSARETEEYGATYSSVTTTTALAAEPGRPGFRSGETSTVKIRGAASTPGAIKEKTPRSPKAVEERTLAYEHVVDTTSVKTSEPVSKRTSLLTAGEVNDFKKWKMWEDYNEADFKIHSSNWNLYTTQRYSVQLQNNDHTAAIGETVFLINKETRKIIWTAVTDNTGKAELWNGFPDNGKEKNVMIEVKGEKSEFIAIPFSQGINHIQLNKGCAVSNKVEIAFVVDATGSMGDEIEYLKEELGDILTKFSLKEPLLELFTSAVFYRDKGDEYITRIQPFSNSLGNTIDFIKKQSAAGGGDYPEALKEALEDATEKLSWSDDARTKIIFLLMDAPPHDAEKNKMAALIANAAAKGIRIVPIACSGTDKATEFIMRSMALATNGTYLFLTDDSGIGNGHIKPTTDEFKVELLNDLLLRIIEQMCFVNTCEQKKKVAEPASMYVNNEKIKVFPNPTQGLVTLETSKELEEIFVADFTGKILMRTVVKDKEKRYKIDLSRFPSATYFIRYITKDKKTGAEKVVLIR